MAVADSPSATRDGRSETPHNPAAADAESLSQRVNILGAKPERSTPSTAGAALPDTQIAGADAQPGWLGRQLNGIGSVASAIGSGVAEKVSNGYDLAKSGVLATGAAVGSLYEHPEQITDAGKRAAAVVATAASDAATATSAFAARAVADPSGTISDVGNALGKAATATGSALETAGVDTFHAGVAGATWVGNHKLETTAMVGAAAVEAFSLGTATPVAAAIAAAGGALAVHSVYSVADHLNEHSQELGVLWNSNDHTGAEVAAARQTIAGDTGGAVIGLAASITGIGAARLIAGKAAVVAEDAGNAGTGVRTAGTGVRTAGAAGSGASQAADVPTTPPTAPRPRAHAGSDTPANSGAVAQPASDARTQPASDARTQSASDAHEQQVQAARAADNAGANDSTGRPLSEHNAERVAEQHPPLSSEELTAQRAAVEKDLSNYKASNGKSILDQINSSDLSQAQRDRVLDTLAETRSSYMRPGTDGQVPAEQLGSYRHTLGELKEGLDSAKANGLNPRETQDALLAGMLSDSHKYGWSAASGGNFFTHHLDGALAADTILSRQLGEGFDAQDLDAVKHAILEHQISPPQFMGQAYASEIRSGMTRAGVTPTAEQTAEIANIQKLMSDPLHAPVEADSQGGYRVSFTPQERDLLRQYVGEGTQNWHVPAPTAAADSTTAARTTTAAGTTAGASNSDATALDPAKVSTVVRAADIFDNYSPEMGADGQAIKGPFKIAALRGPMSNPPDLSLDDSIAALKNNMRQSESLLSAADKARAIARAADEDPVYNQARNATADWLKAQGITPGADTPFFGKPLEAPPANATAEQMQAWRQRPDVKLGAQIQAHFAQELHDMRLIQ